jgi:hypothetical protein
VSKGDAEVLVGFENTEWRQGHLLNAADIKRLFPSQDDSANLVAVVISHDCDLAREPAAEPVVEVVFGKVVEKLDGNLTHAKNARKLQVAVTGGSQQANIELHAPQRSVFPKTELITTSPSASLKFAKDEVTILQSWLAARYRRSAFPNEFNNRLASGKIPRELSKKLEPLGELVSALYFDLENDEEIADEKGVYKLGIYILYTEDGDDDKFSKITNLVKEIKQIFQNAFYKNESDEWFQVELIDCEEISDRAMSIGLVGKLKRWNADYISLRAAPQQVLPDQD